MSVSYHPLPIYRTSGDVGGYLQYPYIFSVTGEWIGWVTSDKKVFSVYGDYIGWLDKYFRILRKRTYDKLPAKQTVPPKPGRFVPPASVPLAPLMAELNFNTIDVLEDMPELLPTDDVYAYYDDPG
jgi:hypothetical protein